MDGNKASITALVTAFARAYHSLNGDPKVFDDFLAIDFFTEEERKFFEMNMANLLKVFNPEEAELCIDQASMLAKSMKHQAPTTIGRTRFTEDNLLAAVDQGVSQYVILGAGMDTFAFRHRDILKKLQVFELDHPSTQEFKKNKIAQLEWNKPQQLHFIPIDFTKENLVSVLANSSYNPDALSFISWLGVTFYLPKDVIFDTLRSIAQLASPGSSIIFDYMDADALIPGKACKYFTKTQEIVKMAGEPMQTGFNPDTFEADIESTGLKLKKNLNSHDINQIYFSNRSDGYSVPKHINFALAVVKE